MAIAFPITYIRSFCFRAYSFYHLHSDILSACGRLTLYTNLVAQKVFEKFPARVANFSRVGLSYTGVIYLNLSLREFGKGCGDLFMFLRYRNALGVALTAAKVAYQGIDIVMVAGGFVVSIAAVAGYAHWITAFYLFMRPYTVTSLALSAISQAADYAVNTKLIAHTMPERVLWIRSQFNTWDHQRLAQEPGVTERGLLQNKLICTRNRFGIMVVDYVLLTVCALKPDTLVSTGLLWGRSIVAIIMLYQEKFGNARAVVV